MLYPLSMGQLWQYHKKSDCNAYYKSGQFDAEVLVQNLFEVLTGHVFCIVCCHRWYYLCDQTYKSLLSYKQISRWHKKLKNGNDSIRFTSQFCEQSKGINVAERFPQSILLHYTAFITTLATLGTTWQQCGQAWAQLGITWWPLVKHILSSWVPHNNHLWPYRDPQGTRDI